MLNKKERLSKLEKQIKLKRMSNNNDPQYNAQVIVSRNPKKAEYYTYVAFVKNSPQKKHTFLVHLSLF